MKSERLELLLTILLCLLAIVTYARFNDMHLRLVQSRLESLNSMVGRLSSLQANFDLSLKTYANSLRQISEKVSASDQSRADIVARLETLAKDIESLAAGKQAKKAVELDPIAVKKQSKTRTK